MQTVSGLFQGAFVMANATIKKSKFVAGGNVQAGGGIYIKREADEKLLEFCRQGEFAYILTSRQMGKSSLMVNTMRELARVGVKSASIDLTILGTDLSAEQWYRGFLEIIVDQLLLKTDVSEWWKTRSHLGYTQRLALFFQEVLLRELPAPTPIVIFVDEIDSTLSFRDEQTGTSFTDDFFAAIRAFFNDRSINPDMERLSFVLIGVATPTDLIHDSKRTPFNIGHRVELDDFTLSQALPLTAGFDVAPEKAVGLLQSVFHWTCGHPFLTQRLCQEIASQHTLNPTRDDVDQTVQELFLGDKGVQVSNINYVRDMLTRPDRVPNGDLGGVLALYRKILADRKAVPDEERSQLKSYLKLSGVVRREAGNLQVRNPIYRHIFNEKWVKDHLNTFVGRKIAIYRRGAALAIAAMLVLSLLAGVWRFQLKETRAAEAREKEARLSAIEARERADENANKAKQEKLNADQQTREAEEAKRTAQIALEKAESETARARKAEKNAIEQKKIAEEALYKLGVARDDLIAANKEALKQKEEADKNADKANAERKKAIENELIAIENQKNATRASAISNSQSKAATSMQNLARNPDDSLNAALEAAEWVKEERVKSLKPGTVDLKLPWEAQDALRHAYLESRRRILIDSQVAISGISYGPQSKIKDGARYVVTASDDNIARVWYVDSQDVKNTHHVADLAGHKQAVQSAVFNAVSSGDNHRIVTASYDHTARVWDFPFQKIEEKVRVYLGGGKNDLPVLIPFDGEQGVQLLIPPKSHETEKDQNEESRRERLQYAVFSPDNKFILTSSRNGVATTWEEKNGKFVVKRELKGHGDVIYTAFYNRIGDRIVTASADGTAKVWDAATGDCLQTLRGHLDRVRQAVFNYKGDRVATASSDNLAIIWDWKTGKREHILRGHSAPIWSVIYNYCDECPVEDKLNREELITTSEDRTARVWDGKTGNMIAELRGHRNIIWRAEFAPDGQYVITASQDKTARIWNIARERRLITFNPGTVAQLAYSPNGKMIATVAPEGYPILWDASTGRKLVELHPPGEMNNDGRNRLRNWLRRLFSRGSWDLSNNPLLQDTNRQNQSFLLWNERRLVAIHRKRERCGNQVRNGCPEKWEALLWSNRDLTNYLVDTEKQAETDDRKQAMVENPDSRIVGYPLALPPDKMVLAIGLISSGSQLAVAYEGGEIELISLSNEGPIGAQSHNIGADTLAMTYSWDGKYGATVDGHGSVRRLNFETMAFDGEKIELRNNSVPQVEANKPEKANSVIKIACDQNCSKALIIAHNQLSEIDFRTGNKLLLTDRCTHNDEEIVELWNASYSRLGAYILVAGKYKKNSSSDSNWNVKMLSSKNHEMISILTGHDDEIITAISDPHERSILTADARMIRISPPSMFKEFDKVKDDAQREKDSKTTVTIGRP
jgi:WD40 repeat protein